MAGATQQKAKKRSSSSKGKAKTPSTKKRSEDDTEDTDSSKRRRTEQDSVDNDQNTSSPEEASQEAMEVSTATTKPSGSKYRHLYASLQDKDSLKITLRSYIARDFFPMVKFIVNKEKLAYFSREQSPNSYCARITQGCGISSGEAAVQWWEEFAKREVIKKINQLRSDRLTTLKWTFIGK